MKQTSQDPVDSSVPRGLQVASAVCWRLLIIAAALWVLTLIVVATRVVVIPIAVALLLSALMAPAVNRLTKSGVPRGLAAGFVLIAGLAIVAGVLTFVISAFTNGLPEMVVRLTTSVETIRNWLINGPLSLEQDQIDQFLAGFIDMLQENQEIITSGALSTAATVGELLAGILLTLFTLIFFLYDGEKIWSFLVKIVPANVRTRVHTAGTRSFRTLVGYVRATALVAVVDALGIGIGLLILDVPLAIPLAALVFLAAFVPIIGAVLSGSVAVLVALVTVNPVTALLVLLVVLLVQQLEGHVLQPLLLGRAVRLHPLAVVLAIAVGVVQAGIAGALLVVPLLAVLNAAVKSLRQDAANEPEEEPQRPRLSLPKLNRLNPGKARAVLPKIRKPGARRRQPKNVEPDEG
ncbi:AI-2E family transporter [Actinoalloteichus fjordicus]|uniref:AI-2E family transporter n=1 Tax=Actinoalloteichus fjordicus TaxID=1612552 RepID=UPI0009F91D13|nr:AI-2E family transporter [Actinoalloteichus fjordicus]